MEKEPTRQKEESMQLIIGFLYNMILLLAFIVLILIIREWYIMPMLLLWDRSHLQLTNKNKT